MGRLRGEIGMGRGRWHACGLIEANIGRDKGLTELQVPNSKEAPLRLSCGRSQLCVFVSVKRSRH